ncbi:MAG: sugar ABC transporter substrate-binding protein [Chloroflexi bacterium]|nr:sugar ABC transporter substrate-binding protein [Chloroflexota bacterium]
MKRFLFILVIASLLLAGCGGAKTPAAGNQPVASSAPAVSTAPTEISMMMWGDPAELDVWNQIVADFHQANPNITVKVEVSDWDSYWTKLKTLLSAGTPPDVFAMDAPLYLDYQSRGVLLNLQPYLNKNPDMLNGVYPQTLEAYKTPDGMYGLPRDFQTIVLFYNKDMFDAAGVAYPTADWTYDDLRAAAKKLTKIGADGKVTQFGYSLDLWDFEPGMSEIIWSYGGDLINAEHTKTLVGAPKAREAFQFLHDMMFVDKSIPDTNTASEYGGDPFLAGVSAMTAFGHWVVPGYTDAKFNWDIAPMPNGPSGRATSVNSAGFVVGKASKNPDAAFEFLKYVLSEPAQTRLAELGFACPVLKSVAESDAFLKQKTQINQKIFLDSLAFAHMKPVFKGYDEWSSTIGDGMAPVWTGEAELGPTLDTVVPAADEVLANNQ